MPGAVAARSVLEQHAGGAGQRGSLTQSAVNSLLGAVPAYFKQAVITPDNREATLAFGIRLMPLSKQQQVISYMRSQLHPPPGVSARLAGLPVLAAEANTALSSSARRLLTLLAGLVAVGLVLLAVFRRPRRALVPLVPIALATGWSALILFAIRIPLNPMSATLGALVIAISTEFSVLLSERFRQEREAGHDLQQALERTYRSTGAAVLASGITAIAGFGVLVLSSITMLRDFGFVTLIDLGVSLGGVLLVLPATLALAEDGQFRVRVRELTRRAGARRPRFRRGTGRVSEHRLDPDRPRDRSHATERGRQAAAGDRYPALPADHRRDRIGIAVVISAALFITHGGVGAVGIPPGHRLHWFVAPLSGVNFGKRDDANLAPRAISGHPNPRALNICPWLANQKPLVLAFFVTGTATCSRGRYSRRSPGVLAWRSAIRRGRRAGQPRLGGLARAEPPLDDPRRL